MGKYDVFLRGTLHRSLVDPVASADTSSSQEVRGGISFEDIYAAQLPAGSVRFSNDAQDSLKRAGIELTPLELDRVGRAIDGFRDAGGHRGLLVTNKVTAVIDVAERLITAAKARNEARDEVFSDVDSVMLIDDQI